MAFLNYKKYILVIIMIGILTQYSFYSSPIAITKISSLFPVLPNNYAILGGSVAISNLTDYSTGMILDENFNNLITIPEINSSNFMESWELENIIKRFYLNYKSPNQYDYHQNLANGFLSNKPQYIIVSNEQDEKEFNIIIGQYCGYSSVLDCIVMEAPKEGSQYNIVLSFIDKNNGILISKLEVNKNYSIMPIMKDLYFGSVGNEDGLVDLRQAKIIYKPPNGLLSFNDNYLATSKEIYDTKQRKVIVNLETLEINATIINIKPAYIEYIYNPQINHLPEDLPMITRVSLDGKILYKEQYCFSKPCTIVDSYENKLLTVNKATTENTLVYSIVDSKDLQTLLEFPIESGIFFVGDKAISLKPIPRMWDLTTLKFIKEIPFPPNPVFLTSKDERFVILQDNLDTCSLYKLGSRFNVIANTRTTLDTGDSYCLLNDDFITLKTTIKQNAVRYDSFDLSIRITHHKIQSPFNYNTASIKTIADMINIDKPVIDGLDMYIATGFGKIENYDIQTGALKMVFDANVEKYDNLLCTKSQLIIKDGILAVSQIGSKNTSFLFCFDVNTGKILLKQSFENKINIMSLDKSTVTIEYSGYVNIYSFEDKHLEKIKGHFILKDTNKIWIQDRDFSSTFKNKYKLTIYDIISREFNNNIMNEEIPRASSILGEYFSSAGNIFTINGGLVQKSLGVWGDIIKTQAGLSSIAMKYDANNEPLQNGQIINFSPCPTFSVSRSNNSDDKLTFSFTNTRQDDLDLVLKSEVYLASWGDDGKPPIFTKLDEPHHKLGPLLPGMSQEITFDLPKPLEIDGKKSEGKYFALIVESNGLLDTKNSELSDFDREGRPLFDGTPLSLDKQHAIVLTVWKK